MASSEPSLLGAAATFNVWPHLVAPSFVRSGSFCSTAGFGLKGGIAFPMKHLLGARTPEWLLH